MQINFRQYLLSFIAESFSPILKSKDTKLNKCKSVVLSLAVYRCESWSLKLREEHRLGVFLHRMLRKIFELKKEERGD